MECSTECNNHIKMFRRFTLWGTDQVFKVLLPSVFELLATPFFRTHNFGRKLENLHYSQFVRYRFGLCLLVQYQKSMTFICINYNNKRKWYFGKKKSAYAHMEDFWVLRYPKIVAASCINHFISLALYLWLCILRCLHRVFWCPELIPGDSFMIWLF